MSRIVRGFMQDRGAGEADHEHHEDAEQQRADRAGKFGSSQRQRMAGSYALCVHRLPFGLHDAKMMSDRQARCK